MTAGTLLRRARKSTGLTQAAVAHRARLPQPRVSEVERNTNDPSVSRLERLLRATGHGLIAVPSTLPPIDGAAADIRALLEQGLPELAFRRFVQAADDLERAPLPIRIALSCSPPDSTGHAGFDAALAALVEHRTAGAGPATPGWAFDEWRVADGWCPTDNPILVEESRRTAPAAFSRRGVYVSTHDLESV